MKRKSLVCLVCLLALLSLNANAQKSLAVAPITVAEALNLKDDALVTLQGKIVKQQGDEKYLFQDNTGTIIVDIDDKILRNVSIGQNDMIEISGEIDKGWFKGIEVDVESIKKL